MPGNFFRKFPGIHVFIHKIFVYVCSKSNTYCSVVTGNEEIIKKLKAGDEQVFDTVYKQYYRGLCAFASQYVAETETEEIVQDAMMWLWENHNMLIPEMSLKSLLFTIVKNKCLNNITHNQIKQQVHEKLYARFKNQFEDPDFYLEEELTTLLHKAILKLPEEYRKAFELNRFHHLTYNEIAKRTGVSPKTIAYRISQSLKILREELKDYMFLFLAFLQ